MPILNGAQQGPEETERYRHRASGLPQLPVAERQQETIAVNQSSS